MAPLACCYCLSNKCNGTFVKPSTKRTHERTNLRLKFTIPQSIHRGLVVPHDPKPTPALIPPYPVREPILLPRFEFPDPPVTSTCVIEQQMLDHGTLTQEDIDIQLHGSDLPNLDAVDYYSMYNELTTAGARPLTPHIAHNLPCDPEQRALECQLEQITEEFHQNQHTELDQDIDMFDPGDDEMPEPEYTACNAFLAIIACLLTYLSPQLQTTFVTLQSATQVLGLDMPVTLLPTCPGCRNVYLPAGSPHTQDTCVPCSLDLFLPNKTRRGNDRAKKIPYIKYPYLPLSLQLHSLLAIPGIEETLDQWRTKPRSQGQYSDIFDGDVCRTTLKAPDGTIFFSNMANENRGPQGELRIGVNLGIDW
ncbi:hypothetical protein PAXRUDRAFT_36999 [Paxillus rubicundulus Ve08.2h10]|uniref:Unplaced genomic scaffold scaffold_3478, whole genome shotgun sequence n=1 Tax=Paxillus rubicundulus Ve08.2h10 TaxID=930991 RepID=A0A0D0DCQ7_9AGAM|nr:hypothetical protein PAXRUDRAFT_36999 [Paxillus rubicundulus Ve08.2h10]